MSRGRDDAGRFEETVTDQDILKVFDYDDDPVLTAPEVTERLRQFGKPMTSEGVRNRLNSLAEEGLIERKEVGARAVVWWATVAPELAPATADRVETRRDADEWEPL